MELHQNVSQVGIMSIKMEDLIILMGALIWMS